jgi:hypothetical protein
MATGLVTEPTSDAPSAEERKAARKQSLPARAAYLARRRERVVERDARRFQLAEELRRSPPIEISTERGFVVVPPGAVSGAEDVVRAANEVIDGLGHDALVAIAHRDKTKRYLAARLVDRNTADLDSVYLKFALSEHVLAPVCAYLGLVPVLYEFDVWYSMPQPDEPQASQLWHLDHDDEKQVKVWVHCSDVDEASGPLTVIDAATSDEVAERLGYDFGEGHRVADDQVEELAGPAVTRLEGAAGTVHFVDTSRCFHMGSRVAPGGTPRRVFVAQYLTPYAFRFRPDHLQKAPYRNLANEGSSELERLLLGAA